MDNTFVALGHRSRWPQPQGPRHSQLIEKERPGDLCPLSPKQQRMLFCIIDEDSILCSRFTIRQAPFELCSGLEDDLRPAIVARIKMLIPFGRLGEWQSV